jgi:hypothetical protein
MVVASAAVLDHFGRLAQEAFSGGVNLRTQALGRIAAAAVIALMVGLIGFQNWQSYFVGFLNHSRLADVTLQGTYVRQHAASTRFYTMGVPALYWDHGDRRFLAPSADGIDATNPSGQLPIIDNGTAANKDAAFLVWEPMADYLPILQSFYPEGRSEVLPLNTGQPGSHMTAFTVTSQQIDAHRVLSSRYVPAKGVPIEAPSDVLGSSDRPPSTQITYPVSAAWDGAVVAPAYSVYSFRLTGSEGSLSIDGIEVVKRDKGAGDSPSDGIVVLAQGPHTVHLGSMLPDAQSSVSVAWRSGGGRFQPIARRYLWDGHVGQRWLAELRRPEPPRASSQQPALEPLDDSVLSRRVDGFVGFRGLQLLVPGAVPFDGSWTNNLEAKQAGAYRFALRSSAGGSVKIDGVPIIDLSSSGEKQAAITLAPGMHRVEVNYLYRGGDASLEFSWAPPQGRLSMITPGSSPPAPAIWSPTRVRPPPVPQVLSGADSVSTIAIPDVSGGRGLAVDSSGLLYVGDEAHERVIVFNDAGQVLRTWGGKGDGPGQFQSINDMEVGPNGQLYVLDSALLRIQRFSLDGQLQGTINGHAEWCSPAGFTVDGASRVWLANTCRSLVQSYSTNGELLNQTDATDPYGQRLEQPTDVFVANDGTVFISDLRNRLLGLTPRGAYQFAIPLTIGTARGAAKLAGSAGWVYVTDPDHGSLFAIDLQDRVPFELASGGHARGQLLTPTGIAVGRDGRIFVLDSGNRRIQSFAPPEK